MEVPRAEQVLCYDLFNKGSKTSVSLQNTAVLNLKGKTNMAQVKPIRVGQTIPKEAKQKQNKHGGEKNPLPSAHPAQASSQHQ